jgi:hypothetical protein
VQFIATLFFCINNGVADVASTVSSSKIILKTIQVNFEPVEVLLLEQREDDKLGSVVMEFRVLKAKAASDNRPNNIVVALTAASSEYKPLAILIRASPDKLDSAEAISVSIEPTDIVETSVVGPIREKILEYRSQFTSLKKELIERQDNVAELKSKAAAITRLNRLVEAQTTVTSLGRKLEGLKSDRANISLLLDIIGQQSSSARLASNQAALSRDLRLLIEEGAGAKNQKGVLLTDTKREAARKVIEKARGLDLEKLREQVQGLRNEQYQDSTEDNSYLQSPEL